MDKETQEALAGLTGCALVVVLVVLGGSALAATAVRIFNAIV